MEIMKSNIGLKQKQFCHHLITQVVLNLHSVKKKYGSQWASNCLVTNIL